MTGDEDVDMIYAASWTGFADYVRSEAYTPFDMEFVKTWMPLTSPFSAQSPCNYRFPQTIPAYPGQMPRPFQACHNHNYTTSPLTYQNQPEESWEVATFDGKIYGIPPASSWLGGNGFVTTQDLLDKCDTPADHCLTDRNSED